MTFLSGEHRLLSYGRNMNVPYYGGMGGYEFFPRQPYMAWHQLRQQYAQNMLNSYAGAYMRTYPQFLYGINPSMNLWVQAAYHRNNYWGPYGMQHPAYGQMGNGMGYGNMGYGNMGYGQMGYGQMGYPVMNPVMNYVRYYPYTTTFTRTYSAGGQQTYIPTYQAYQPTTESPVVVATPTVTPAPVAAPAPSPRRGPVAGPVASTGDPVLDRIIRRSTPQAAKKVVAGERDAQKKKIADDRERGEGETKDQEQEKDRKDTSVEEKKKQEQKKNEDMKKKTDAIKKQSEEEKKKNESTEKTEPMLSLPTSVFGGIEWVLRVRPGQTPEISFRSTGAAVQRFTIATDGRITPLTPGTTAPFTARRVADGSFALLLNTAGEYTFAAGGLSETRTVALTNPNVWASVHKIFGHRVEELRGFLRQQGFSATDLLRGSARRSADGHSAELTWVLPQPGGNTVELYFSISGTVDSTLAVQPKCRTFSVKVGTSPTIYLLHDERGVNINTPDAFVALVQRALQMPARPGEPVTLLQKTFPFATAVQEATAGGLPIRGTLIHPSEISESGNAVFFTGRDTVNCRTFMERSPRPTPAQLRKYLIEQLEGVPKKMEEEPKKRADEGKKQAEAKEKEASPQDTAVVFIHNARSPMQDYRHAISDFMPGVPAASPNRRLGVFEMQTGRVSSFLPLGQLPGYDRLAMTPPSPDSSFLSIGLEETWERVAKSFGESLPARPRSLVLVVGRETDPDLRGGTVQRAIKLARAQNIVKVDVVLVPVSSVPTFGPRTDAERKEIQDQWSAFCNGMGGTVTSIPSTLPSEQRDKTLVDALHALSHGGPVGLIVPPAIERSVEITASDIPFSPEDSKMIAQSLNAATAFEDTSTLRDATARALGVPSTITRIRRFGQGAATVICAYDRFWIEVGRFSLESGTVRRIGAGRSSSTYREGMERRAAPGLQKISEAARKAFEANPAARPAYRSALIQESTALGWLSGYTSSGLHGALRERYNAISKILTQMEQEDKKRED